MEQDLKKRKSFQKQDSYLCRVSKDILNLIVSYYPCPIWFILCKELHSLLTQAINPLHYKQDDDGAFLWTIKVGNLEAFTFLLQDPRIDPAAHDSFAIILACLRRHGEEMVKLLLRDGRADPSAQEHYAIQTACDEGHEELVELLLQGTFVLNVTYLPKILVWIHLFMTTMYSQGQVFMGIQKS
jgi:hypothetical protein